MYPIRYLLIFAALWLPQFASASDPFSGGGGQSLFSSAPVFLPVEEAYRLSVTQEGGETLLHWSITDGYYLYRHQFKFYNADMEQMAVEPEYSHTGSFIYDELYEKDLEVFYGEIDLAFKDKKLDELGIASRFIVESQACADAGLCYPPRRQEVDISASGQVDIKELEVAASNNVDIKPGANVSVSLWVALSFALLGGVILNLMPCVFPILSIKVLSLSTHHQNPRQKVTHGLIYGLGVVVSFILIAGLMLLLRSAGKAVGWGFQLQSPLIVMVLIYLFVLMGLSFSGVFSIGSRWMNFGQQSTAGVSLHSSFMAGILAVVVASPCSAPFMGTALGFALSQTAAVSLVIFAMLGLGMALPVMSLCAWPGLERYLPRPGAWMERLKQLLAFPLYLTAVWLLWVLDHQAGSDTVAAILAGVVLLVFAIWLFQLQLHRLVLTALVVLSVVFAALLPFKTYLASAERETNNWEPYTPARLQQLLDAGEPVFLNATADWCITCLANEKAVLESSEIANAMSEKGIHYLKADWTGYDKTITDLLNSHQRSGVPLYLFYPRGDKSPVTLPQILSKSALLAAFDES